MCSSFWLLFNFIDHVHGSWNTFICQITIVQIVKKDIKEQIKANRSQKLPMLTKIRLDPRGPCTLLIRLKWIIKNLKNNR